MLRRFFDAKSLMFGIDKNCASAVHINLIGTKQCREEEKMKKKIIGILLTAVTTLALTGCGSGAAGAASTTATSASTAAVVESSAAVSSAATVASEAVSAVKIKAGATYKVGIVQYVDDASLNQIEKSVEQELDAKGKAMNATFDYSHYTFNGQADSTVLNQIAAELVNDKVDVIIPIATPTAMIMQTATEDNQIPVVFAAVSDPVGAGLVKSMDAPGSNITGTSDALNTKAVFDLMLASNPKIKTVGLLYNNSEDSSKKPIADAKAYCAAKNIKVVEKTGTTNDEITQAADALVAAGVNAVFTPTDNTVMTAELSIYEKFIDAKIPQYAGADSFALNGAFCGYGVNYAELGKSTADMAVEILGGVKPSGIAVKTVDDGIATINTDTASAIGADYSKFSGMCEKVKEVKTAENFGK